MGEHRKTNMNNRIVGSLRWMLCALLLVVIITMSACSAEQGNLGTQGEAEIAPAHYDDTITVLCYGDSNTYGYDPATKGERYPDNVRWTNLLAEELGSDYYVITEGLSGRTTAYDRTNAEWKNGLTSLVPTLGSQKPVDVVVFMLGTNDCMKALELTPEEIAAGMESLIVTTKEMTPKLQGYEPGIIVVAPPVIDPYFEGGTFASLYDETAMGKSVAIASLYKQLAEQYDCYYVDGSGNEVSEIDGVHLTEAGHQKLAEQVYQCIVR